MPFWLVGQVVKTIHTACCAPWSSAVILAIQYHKIEHECKETLDKVVKLQGTIGRMKADWDRESNQNICWKDGYSPSLVASYAYGAKGYGYCCKRCLVD